MLELEKLIEKGWEDRDLVKTEVDIKAAIKSIIDMLDKGEIRVVEPTSSGWQLNDWVRKAVILYFIIRRMEYVDDGYMVYNDKLKLKRDYKYTGVRVVPPAVARYGAFFNSGVILMPSYVNIGAYIDTGTMIDIGAGIGSCAQIGKNVHVSAGVVIGGVLEPIQANPVIIEDNVFIGANSSIVEGVLVRKNSVISSGLNITGSSKIIDTTTSEETIYQGEIPENSVVIPGSYKKKFGSREYNVACGLIIGQRTESTDAKVALNELLRETPNRAL